MYLNLYSCRSNYKWSAMSNLQLCPSQLGHDGDILILSTEKKDFYTVRDVTTSTCTAYAFPRSALCDYTKV